MAKKAQNSSVMAVNAGFELISEIHQYTYLITGKTPLLINNAAAMLAPNGGQPSAKETDPAKIKKAIQAKLYLDGDGNLTFPSAAFVKAMSSAAPKKKLKGTGGKAMEVREAIRVAVTPVEDFSILEDPGNGKPIRDYEVDSRTARTKKGDLIISHRPVIKSWQLKLVLELDVAVISPVDVATLLCLGGYACGVGNFRRQKSGKFGSFTAELMPD